MDLSNLGCFEYPWFNETSTVSALTLQSSQVQCSNMQTGNQEELDWADYICIPNESPVTDDIATTESTIRSPVSSPGGPATPSAPTQQTPLSAVSALPQNLSTTAKPMSGRSSSIQKRRRPQSTATAQLRPNFPPILPSPYTVSVEPPHIPSKCAQHEQEPTSDRGAKRSTKTSEEGLRKRRNYQRLAEHSRRLRLNAALKELEALLPSTIVQEKYQRICPAQQEKPKKEKKKAALADQTKACVIELAIGYIKMLRTTLNEKNMRMRELGAAGSSMLL
ncbi:transcriptional regulator family: Helix-loop-helix [Penicillium roqueforti]|nr:transcriptional regulator family: Helix-loop-helix [Penicillium roqueforti]